MKIILCFLLLVSMLTASAQQSEADKILKEGQLLYRLEKASWYGTDFLMNNFSKKKDSVGGYLSYVTDKNRIINIFFDRTIAHDVLISFEFDSLPKEYPSSFDPKKRTATKIEKDLIAIRQDAVDKIAVNDDKFFTFYKNTCDYSVDKFRCIFSKK